MRVQRLDVILSGRFVVSRVEIGRRRRCQSQSRSSLRRRSRSVLLCPEEDVLENIRRQSEAKDALQVRFHCRLLMRVSRRCPVRNP